MNLVLPRVKEQEQTKKDKIRASFAKAVKANGKALEKLSKN